MLIGYVNERLRKMCEDGRVAAEQLPPEVARLLPLRLSQLAAFACLAEVPCRSLLYRHRLDGRRWAGHHAVLIDGEHRVIFKPVGVSEASLDGGPDLGAVTSIEIVAVGDHR